MNKEEELIDRLIDLAFAEDIGDGDHTTLSCIPATAMGKSKLLIKEAGILAGIEVAKEVFRRFDPTMKVEVFINDGTEVKPGDVAMVVEGKVQSLLQTERLMLNIMQRMSGIATMTHKYAEKLKGTNTRVLDTRKTTYQNQKPHLVNEKTGEATQEKDRKPDHKQLELIPGYRQTACQQHKRNNIPHKYNLNRALILSHNDHKSITFLPACNLHLSVSPEIHSAYLLSAAKERPRFLDSASHPSTYIWDYKPAWFCLPDAPAIYRPHTGKCPCNLLRCGWKTICRPEDDKN